MQEGHDGQNEENDLLVMQARSTRPSSSTKQSCCSGTYAGTVSKSCGPWASSLELPRGFSYKTMCFIKGEDKVLSPAIRAEITNAVFSR